MVLLYKNFYFFPDYTMTDKGFLCSNNNRVIFGHWYTCEDDIFVNQNQLSCLLDPVKYLNDDVSVSMCFKISLSNINNSLFYK
jgi:hypothetical protein